MKLRKILVALIGLGASWGALADGQWVWETGKQTTNGAITLKSASGGGSYSGTRNPTGAVAKMNQSAATQPPTVIIQATATLSIKTVGDACTVNTSGTNPNQSAAEGTAITLDRTLILTCQSGVWNLIKAAPPTCGQWCGLAGKGPIQCGPLSYTYARAKVLADGSLQFAGSNAEYLGGSGLQSINWFAYQTGTTVSSNAYMDQVAYGGGAHDLIGSAVFTVTSSGITISGSLCATWP